MNTDNLCSHCHRQIAYDPNGNKMLPHIHNQYGQYHNECWPIHKAGMDRFKKVK